MKINRLATLSVFALALIAAWAPLALAQQTVFLQAQNNATGTLLNSISAGATSFDLQSGEGDKFPSAYPYRLVLGTTEIVEVTNKSGDTFTVTRGAESTTPASHPAGQAVSLNVTAGYITQIQDSVNTLETAEDLNVDITTYDPFSITDEDGTPDVDIVSLIHYTADSPVSLTSFVNVEAGQLLWVHNDATSTNNVTIVHDDTPADGSPVLPSGQDIILEPGDPGVPFHVLLSGGNLEVRLASYSVMTHEDQIIGGQKTFTDGIVAGGISDSGGITTTSTITADGDATFGDDDGAHTLTVIADGNPGMTFSRRSSSIGLSQNLGVFLAGGIDDDVTKSDAATIHFAADTAWGAGDAGSKIVFSTTANGTTTRSAALTLRNNKTAEFAGDIQTAGDLDIDGGDLNSTASTLNVNPSVTFNDETIYTSQGFTDTDTTPSIAGGTTFDIISDSGGYTITRFDDYTVGQRVTVRNLGITTVTIAHDSSGSDNGEIRTMSGANVSLGGFESMTFDIVNPLSGQITALQIAGDV